MPLSTNRQFGDIVEAHDINLICETVNVLESNAEGGVPAHSHTEYAKVLYLDPGESVPSGTAPGTLIFERTAP